VDEKLRSAGAEREERALTGIVARPVSAQAVPIAGSGERVVLWVPDAPALRVLRDMLAVAGYRPYILRAGAAPTAEVGNDLVRAFVVDGASAAAKLAELRAIDGLAQVPVVVIDAGSGAEIADLIAAGASDVAAAGASSDEIAKKVRRVLKRRR
jgi:DNA-binding NarL/FixJ family response regulator